MPPDPVSAVILFFAGLAAGTINAIAGGGSLFTLPLLIFLGLPPTVANGTNRIAVLSGTRRRKYREGGRDREAKTTWPHRST